MYDSVIALALLTSARFTEPVSKPLEEPRAGETPSALVALREVRALLEATTRGAIDLERITCKSVLSAEGSRVEATLDLAISAADLLEATRLWNSLFESFEASEWCLDARSGSVHPEKRGLLAPRLLLMIDPRDLAPTPKAGSAQLHIHARTAAARKDIGIGQIECSRREVTTPLGTRATLYSVRPESKQSSSSLDQLCAFFRCLESVPGAVITSIDIYRSTSVTAPERNGGWNFALEMSVDP